MAIFTFGLSLRGCVRLCAVVGIVTSSFYITTGVTLLTRATQEQNHGPYSRPLYLYLTQPERDTASREKARLAINIALGIALVVANVLQIICDTLLFQLSLKSCHGQSLWILFIVDIALWLMTLIIFVNVFPSGGLLLLTIVLVGTSVRCYILYIIHQFFSHLRKSSDSKLNLKSVELIANNDPFIIQYTAP
ncbi:unnamed protein product [Allacma fusca]|uniref:Uncharacterized protein n=1 Tax=Allacma fusca TaxID=39272 RepID=A0A8J2PSF0_9HEXA|nr:unnamed protein product [Allacma fusca]